MKDQLGDRMKKYYEDRTRYLLPRRTYTIIRIDGKAFHTYTRGLKRPFDAGLIEDMDATACYLCKNIQGAKMGFVQSDEISILMTDFDKINTDAWFDGNIQKIASIAASLATAEFNRLRLNRFLTEKYESGITTITELWFKNLDTFKQATFDARVFTIPLEEEVLNYFIWRQQDTVRNSISSVAQFHYSYKELEFKSTSDMQEMIFQKGDNWNDYTAKLKRGRFIFKKEVHLDTPFIREDLVQHSYIRNVWVSGECPTFTQDRNFLLPYLMPNRE
jgi:tRNA(His) 5'-end guanylyltransferase